MSSNNFARPCKHRNLSMNSPCVPPPNPAASKPTVSANVNVTKTSSQTARTDRSQPDAGSKVKLKTDFSLNNERTKYLLETGLMGDVVFLVDNEETKQEERISGHKLILSTRSGVFNRLFNGANAERSSEIRLNDVKAKGFRNLLKFIYYDDAEVSIQSFVPTFIAAEKYEVRSLSKALIGQIKHFDGDKTCILLKHLENQRLANEDLQRELTKKQQIETKKIIDCGEFLNLSLNSLKKLLSNESLNVEEVQLFRAVLRWAKHQCHLQRLEVNPVNLKKTISGLVYLFRYTSMSLEDFAAGPGKLRILTDSELADVFLYLTLKDRPASHQLPTPLSSLKRQPIPVFETMCFKDPFGIEESLIIRGIPNYETSVFKTDSVIFLRGFRSRFGLGEEPRTLYLHRKSGCQMKLIASKVINPSGLDSSLADESRPKFQIEFDYPVLIEPEVNYRLMLHLDGGKATSSKLEYKSIQFGPVKEFSSDVSFYFQVEEDTPLDFMGHLIFHKF